MKIVSTTNQLNMDGLGAAFQASGIDFLFWNPTQKALLDMCHEVKPNLIFITPNVVKENQKAIEIALQKYPQSIWWNLLTNPIKPRANLAQYGGGKKQDMYACEIGMFTYNLPQVSAENMQKYQFPKLDQKFKIWGSNTLPLPNYVGELRQSERKHAIASCNHFFCLTQEEAKNAFLNKVPAIAPDGTSCFIINEQHYQQLCQDTYFQEASEILTLLNFTTEAENCLKIHSKLLEKLL